MISTLSMQQVTSTKVGLKYVCEHIRISESESLIIRNFISCDAKSLKRVRSLLYKSNKIPMSHKQNYCSLTD